MSETVPGHFCWYDLYVPEPGTALDFYGPVIGWTTMPFEDGPEPYDMFVAGETPMGGVMKLSQEAADMGAPPHWMAYVTTPDLKATCARAAELGGTIMAEFDVDNVGSFAVLADPQGVVFSAYQPEQAYEPDEPGPKVGHVSWHELYTDDWEGAWAFYSDLFGWEKTASMEMGHGTYQMYGRDGHQMGGMMNRPDENVPPAWFYYFHVPDIHAAAAAVKANGGEVWNEPMEIPGGDMVAHCRDPQGAMFALHAAGAGTA